MITVTMPLEEFEKIKKDTEWAGYEKGRSFGERAMASAALCNLRGGPRGFMLTSVATDEYDELFDWIEKEIRPGGRLAREAQPIPLAKPNPEAKNTIP